MSFDARRYTNDGLIKQLLLLELHIRDGSVYECGCSWDAHLPLIEGLAEEGIKFAMNETEKQFFDRLMHWARDARLKLQYGIEGEEGMEIEGEHHSNPVSVKKAFEQWLHYAGYKEPKISFDEYHEIVQQLSPEEVKELGKRIKEKQEKEGSSNPVLTVETLRAEGRLIEGKPEKGIYEKDAMYYVVKGEEILWSGRQEEIARSVFEERDPEPRYRHETLQSEELCEPSSFRTVVRDEHRIVVCCPKGEWDASLPEGEQCKVGMISQKVLHPIWEKEKVEHAPKGG